MLSTVIAGLLLSGSDVAYLSDARLDQLVEVRAAAVSAPNLCRALSVDAPVRLQAHSALGEELVVLFAKNRPLKDVMQTIAKHFDWRWTATPEGYMLNLSEAWLKEARDGVRNYHLRRMRADQEEAALNLQMRQPDWSALQRQVIEARNQVFEVGIMDDYKRFAALRQRMRLFDPIAEQLLLEMSDDQLVLASTGKLIFSTAPVGRQERLPSRAMARAREVLAALPKLAGEAQQMFVEALRNYRHGDPPEEDEYLPDWADRHVRPDEQLELVIRFVEGAWEASVLSGTEEVGSGQRSYGSEWDHTYEAEDQPLPMPADLPARFHNPPPDSEPLRSAAAALHRSQTNPTLTEPLQPMASVMLLLAEAADFAFIADAFDPTWLSTSYPEMSSLAQTLARLARELSSDWAESGGWISFRTRDWSYQREAHTPRTILAEAARLGKRGTGMSLDEQAYFASKLNLRQAGTYVIDVVSGTWTILDESPTLYLLKFWHELAPNLKQALRNGQVGDVRALPATARHWLEEWAFYSYANLDEFPDEPEFDDFVVDEVEENQDASRWLPLHARSRANVRAYAGTISGATVGMPLTFYHANEADYCLDRGKDGEVVREAVADWLIIRLELAEGVTLTEYLQGFRAGKPIQPKLEELSPALRERVLRHRDQNRDRIRDRDDGLR
jgi:hypothetical protein